MRVLSRRLGPAAGAALLLPALLGAAADDAPPVLTLYADHMPRGCTDLEFAPDGRLFVTGGSGGSGALYKVPAGGGEAVALVDSGLYARWGLRFGAEDR